MITDLNKKKSTGENIKFEQTFKMLFDRSCHRCGGLMISDHCYDVESTTGEFEILIRKCLSCGESIDPTILKNRFQTQQNVGEPLSLKPSINGSPQHSEDPLKDH